VSRHGGADLLEDLLPLGVPDAGAEGVALQVAGEPDARGQHDVGVGAAALQPAEADVREAAGSITKRALQGPDQVADLGGRSKSSLCTARSSLRRRPARRSCCRLGRVRRQVDLADVLRAAVQPPQQPRQVARS
jgi:hypothetical protein